MMRSRTLICLAPVLLALTFVSAAAQITVDQAVTESHDSTWNRTTRVQRTRVEANGRSIETQVVETPSINGGYGLESAIERETIRDGVDTIREVERRYAPDAEGRRRLFRIIETRTTTVPGRGTTTLRVTYDTDVNGHLQEMEREIQESVAPSDSTKQTTSTLFLLRAGALVPAQKTVSLEILKDGGLIDVRRTVSFADQNGNFVNAELTDTVEEQPDGSTRRKEKRVSQADTGRVPGEGQMTPIQRTETEEWRESNGQEHSVAETYSMFTAGVAADGQLHKNGQVETVRTTMPDGATRTIEERTEINPGVRGGRPQLTRKKTEISRRVSRNQVETQTIIETPTSSGAMKPVCVSKTRSFGAQEPATSEPADPADDNACREVQQQW